MKPDRLARELVQKSLEFHRRRLWLEYGAEDVVAIEVQGLDHTLYATIMGQNGLEHGLNMYVGADALSDLRRILKGEGEDGGMVLEKISFLSFSVEPYGGIPDDARAILKLARFEARRESNAPFFVSKKPGRRSSIPNRTDQKTLLYATNAILSAHEQQILKPLNAFKSRILTLKVAGSVFKPTVEPRIAMASQSQTEAVQSLDFFVASITPLPVATETWLVGFIRLDGAVADDDRTVNMLVIVAQESGSIVNMVPAMGYSMFQAACHLFATMQGKEGHGGARRPRALIVQDHDLLDAIAETVQAMGIPAHYAPMAEAFAAVQAALAEQLEQEASPSAAPAPGSPQSVAEWRATSQSVCELIGHEVIARRRVGNPAQRRFLGCLIDDIDEDEDVKLACRLALCEWVAQYDRPTGRSKTIAEILLKSRKLSNSQRRLLKARCQAAVSFYRVKSVDPGQSLTLTNLLDGKHYVVHDRMLSQSAPIGTTLIASVVPIASWNFIVVYSPPIPAMMADAAMDHLESLGAVFGESSIERGTRLVGRIWPWLIHASRSIPRLKTSDGDDLVNLEATYHILNPHALHDALDSSDDMDIDASSGQYVWLKAPSDSDSSPLGPTVRARLEIVGDELIVGTLSRERMAAIRSWLSELGCLRFVSEQEASPPSGCLDDSLPDLTPEDPLPAEFMEAATEIIHEHNRRWLDTPIPALDDLTPRAAAQRPEFRRKVARLIRSMPDAAAPHGHRIPVDRDSLLREIGLDSETS